MNRTDSKRAYRDNNSFLQSRTLFSSLLDALIYLLGLIAQEVFFLFGFRLLWLAGRVTGDLLYLLNSNKRRRVEGELSYYLSLTPREAAIAARQSFENYYMRHFETLFFGNLTKQMIDRVAYIEGLGNIDEALSKGKGVILLLSHFGSFLLPLPYLGYRGYKVNQITGRQTHDSLIAERIWTWRKNQADKLPVRFIQAERFLRPLYEALKNKEIVAIAFDGKDSANWTVVEFFGRKVRFSTGPFELARRTGAVIIPTFVIKQQAGTHRIVLEPPFKLSDGAGEEALNTDTQRYTDLFVGYLSRYPSHFGMIMGNIEKAYE